MKKAFSIILTIFMLISMLPMGMFTITAGAEDVSSVLTYTITDGEVTITECDQTATGDLVIPSFIEGYPVTSIGDSAFFDCLGLTSIIIPNSVTSIGYGAFEGCRSLTSVTIPDSVTSIGDCAFFLCDSLTSITIPDSVTSIGENTFSYCSSLISITVAEENDVYHSEGNCIIETESKTLITGCKNSIISFDGSVTIIGDCAFAFCNGLTSITIPESVTSIGENAFPHCSSLTSITIPDSVTSIGTSAFSGCDGLTTVYYSGTEEEWNAVAIGSNNESLTSANIIFAEESPSVGETDTDELPRAAASIVTGITPTTSTAYGTTTVVNSITPLVTADSGTVPQVNTNFSSGLETTKNTAMTFNFDGKTAFPEDGFMYYIDVSGNQTSNVLFVPMPAVDGSGVSFLHGWNSIAGAGNAKVYLLEDKAEETNTWEEQVLPTTYDANNAMGNKNGAKGVILPVGFKGYLYIPNDCYTTNLTSFDSMMIFMVALAGADTSKTYKVSAPMFVSQFNPEETRFMGEACSLDLDTSSDGIKANIPSDTIVTPSTVGMYVETLATIDSLTALNTVNSVSYSHVVRLIVNGLETDNNMVAQFGFSEGVKSSGGFMVYVDASAITDPNTPVVFQMTIKQRKNSAYTANIYGPAAYERNGEAAKVYYFVDDAAVGTTWGAIELPIYRPSTAEVTADPTLDDNLTYGNRNGAHGVTLPAGFKGYLYIPAEAFNHDITASSAWNNIGTVVYHMLSQAPTDANKVIKVSAPMSVDRFNAEISRVIGDAYTLNIDTNEIEEITDDCITHIMHFYTSLCDTECNICGEIRTIEHTYSADCDTECDVCAAVRESNVEHSYDDIYDSDCNNCGERREPEYKLPPYEGDAVDYLGLSIPNINLGKLNGEVIIGKPVPEEAVKVKEGTVTAVDSLIGITRYPMFRINAAFGEMHSGDNSIYLETDTEYTKNATELMYYIELPEGKSSKLMAEWYFTESAKNYNCYIYGVKSDLSILEQAMPQMVQLSTTGMLVKLYGQYLTITFSTEEAKSSTLALDEQMKANNGSIDLTVMLNEYANASSKVEYLIKNGAALKAKAAETQKHIENILTAAFWTLIDSVDAEEYSVLFILRSALQGCSADLKEVKYYEYDSKSATVTLGEGAANGTAMLMQYGSDVWTETNIFQCYIELPAGFKGYVKYDISKMYTQNYKEEFLADTEKALSRTDINLCDIEATDDVYISAPIIVTKAGSVSNLAFVDGETKVARNIFTGEIVTSQDICSHSYTNACDTDCDICGQVRDDVVEHILSGIEISKEPTVKLYLEGKDTLDITGGVLTLHFANCSDETVEITPDMVSGFDNTKVGKQTLTVSYGGFTDTFDVEVVAKTLTEVRIVELPAKTKYAADEEFDATGLQLELLYNNGSSELISDGFTVSGFDSSVAGAKTVTVSYGGFNVTFEVSVVAQVVISSNKAKPGDTVELMISLSQNTNIKSAAIENLTFDTTKLELVSVEWMLEDTALSIWDTENLKGAIAYTENTLVNGDILKLTFKVLKDVEETNLSIDCDVIIREHNGTEEKTIEVSVTEGILEIYNVILGDVNGNKVVDSNDAIYVLMHSYFSDAYPVNQNVDFNGDGVVTDADAVYLLMYTFFPDTYPIG